MIFKHTAPWVLDRSPHTGKPKTQTRRPLLPADYSVELTAQGLTVITHVYRGHRLLYHLTNRAVQPGRGQRAVGQTRIVEIRNCAVTGDLSIEDAIAEGFPTRAAFHAVWTALYGKKALDDPCWALGLGAPR